MIYLVGGAARAGKSKLARAFMAEHGVPCLHLDLLMMGFAKGLPEFGVDPDTSASARGERLWPVVRGMATTALEDGVDYLFEGDFLLPGHAAELEASWGHDTRSVFLGYAEASPGAKSREIRSFGGGPNDWVAGLSDERVFEVAATNIRFSRRVRRECADLGLAYFDTSRDLPRVVDSALRYLVGR